MHERSHDQVNFLSRHSATHLRLALGRRRYTCVRSLGVLFMLAGSLSFLDGCTTDESSSQIQPPGVVDGDECMQPSSGSSCITTTGFRFRGLDLSPTTWKYNEDANQVAASASYDDDDDPVGAVEVVWDQDSSKLRFTSPDGEFAIRVAVGQKDYLIVSQLDNDAPTLVEHLVHCTGLNDYLMKISSDPPEQAECSGGTNLATGCFVCDGMTGELATNQVYQKQTAQDDDIRLARLSRAFVNRRVMSARLKLLGMGHQGEALLVVGIVFSALGSMFTDVYNATNHDQQWDPNKHMWATQAQ